MTNHLALPADLRRPFVFTLPLSQRTLRFKEFTELGDEGITEAFQLIADAAKRGDNIGLDEIPTESYFRWLLSHLEADDVVAVYDDVTPGKGDARMSGLLITCPCRYARSPNPPVCTLVVVTAESLATIPVWQDLVRIGFEIGRRQPGNSTDIRYYGCMIDVFVTCYDRVEALRNEGYIVTACVPDAGLVAKVPGHHVSSYVMYKEFGIPQPVELPEPSQSDSSDKAADNDDDVIPSDIQLRRVPYLPVTWTLSNGLQVLIRNLEGHNDIRSYYAAMKSAAAAGKGYGMDELPNMAYFVRWYISGFYNIVYEVLKASDGKPYVTTDSNSSRNPSNDTDNQPSINTDQVTGSRDSNDVIAYSNFGHSWFSRSVNNSLLGDGNTIILPRFRGQKLSRDINDINMGLAVDVKLRHAMSETAMTNIPAIMSVRNSGTMCGSVPRAIYFRKTGWTDLVAVCWLFPEEASFLQRLKQQQQQSNSKL